jgi:hypothetical protein
VPVELAGTNWQPPIPDAAADWYAVFLNRYWQPPIPDAAADWYAVFLRHPWKKMPIPNAAAD